jgi:hypothetical protein
MEIIHHPQEESKIVVETLGYNIVTISDGTEYRVPKHLTREEAFSAVGRVDPSALRMSGIFETFDDKFDYRSGVLDTGLRGRLALSSNFEEKAKVLNERAGPNNWGFTDWSNEPYVTPQGYKNIMGEEPPQGPFKNILIDATGMESWRDFVDIGPEIILGVSTVAAELALPTIPGSGMLGRGAVHGLFKSLYNRGISGRALSAGTGDALANTGLEAYQTWGLGDQKETISELAARIGIEAGIVTGGTALLALPALGIAPAVGMAKRTASRVGAKIGTNPETTKVNSIARILQAEERLGTKIGPENVLPVTIRAIIGDPETASLGPLSKIAGTIESAAARQAGAPRPQAALASKMILTAFKEFKEAGDLSASKINNLFSKQERQALKNFVSDDILKGKGKASYKGIDIAAKELTDGTARGLRNFATQELKGIYKTRIASFEKDFGHYSVDAAATGVTNRQMSNIINKVSDDLTTSDIGLTSEQAQDVLLGLLGPKARRLYKKDGVVKGHKETRTTRTGREVKITTPEGNFTVADILSLDKRLRQNSYKQAGAKNFDVARQNIKASELIHQRLGKMKTSTGKRLFNPKGKVGVRSWAQLQTAYAQAIRPFVGRGKNRGLFKVFEDDAGKGNIEQLVKGIIDGKQSMHLANFLDDMANAFPENNLKAVKEGIYTADEIIGHMGSILIREKAIELGTIARSAGADIAAVRAKAKSIVKSLDDLEAEVLKKFSDKSKKGATTWKTLFRDGSLKDFKKDLNIISGGSSDAAARAGDRILGIQNKAELDTLLNTVIQSAENPAMLRKVTSIYNGIKRREPKGATLIKDMFQAETMTKLMVFARNKDVTSLKGWSDSWTDALNDVGTRSLVRDMLGAKAFKDYEDLALVLKGGLDIDPNAGSIMFGALPLVIIGNLIKGNISGVGKSMALMFSLKGFAPGSSAWKQIKAPLARARRGIQRVDEAASGKVSPKLNSMFNSSLAGGQKAANWAAMGRDGYLAGGVSAMVDQMETSSPLTSPDEILALNREQPEQPQDMQVDPAAVTPDPAPAPAPAPAPIAPPVAPPPAPAAVQGLGQTGLDIGAGIARGGI